MFALPSNGACDEVKVIATGTMSSRGEVRGSARTAPFNAQLGVGETAWVSHGVVSVRSYRRLHCLFHGGSPMNSEPRCILRHVQSQMMLCVCV